MSNDLTKNQKLLVGIGVVIIAGFVLNGKLFNKDRAESGHEKPLRRKVRQVQKSYRNT